MPQIRAAKVFGLPIIVTEQYPRGLGKTVSELVEVLPPDALGAGCVWG